MTTLDKQQNLKQPVPRKGTRLDVIHGSTDNSEPSAALEEAIKSLPNVNGRLFIGYPITRSTVESNRIDALWVSPDYGVVAFDFIKRKDDSKELENRQDDILNQLEIRFRREPKLLERRKLKVPFTVISYAPPLIKIKSIKGYPVVNSKSIAKYFEESIESIADSEWYTLTLSVLENVSRLRYGRKPRHIERDDSRGYKIKQLEESIANLDHMQSKAVMETVDGVQRIRGLAGSGKTIVLALKAAYLHAQNPDWIIRVTFSTRSLKQFISQLIRDFHLELTETEPNWDLVQIVNAWGAPGPIDRNGIYYEFCIENGIEYMNFQSARRRFPSRQIFERVCKDALQQVTHKKELYDLVLVDEAQDLPTSFLTLCYESLKQPKRLVYAYDELQNIHHESSLPSPEEIFGIDETGKPRVSFRGIASTQASADLILSNCYRTSRSILVTAHSIGFGIYRTPPPGLSTGLVQMFDDSQLWEAVGYETENGAIKEGKQVTLKRTPNPSLDFLENHSPLDDRLVFKTFTNPDAQSRWIAEEIQRNVLEDELKLTDIMVIDLHPLHSRVNLGSLGARLMNMKIHSHYAGVDSTPDEFTLSGFESIPFSGVHRAKGNEAAMVYITSAECGLSSFARQASVRNRLFTAITRSKAWVRVTGVGKDMSKLEAEFNTLKDRGFRLKFLYPTTAERANLRTIHADTDIDETFGLTGLNRQFYKILKEFEKGTISMEELDPELVDRFQQVISSDSA